MEKRGGRGEVGRGGRGGRREGGKGCEERHDHKADRARREEKNLSVEEKGNKTGYKGVKKGK